MRHASSLRIALLFVLVVLVGVACSDSPGDSSDPADSQIDQSSSDTTGTADAADTVVETDTADTTTTIDTTPDGVDVPELAAIGDPCTAHEECASDLCAVFGLTQICTELCSDETCSLETHTCFDGQCTPEDFCDVGGDTPVGPGCSAACAGCGSHAQCVEPTQGVYECECEAGYEGNGATCTDLDECALDTHTCDDTTEDCVNTEGAFTCSCADGYEDQSGTCADVDECAVNPCGLGTCGNEAGSYTCSCPSLYSFDGSTCVDINECALANMCGVGLCTNEVGSAPGYTCSCPDLYTFDGTTCVDVDECAAGTNPCGVGTCANEVGNNPGYSCTCPASHMNDGTTCVEIDECATGSDLCGVGACVDEVGSYSCTCPSLYTFDGSTCVDIDECATGTNPCGVGTCANEVGTDPGYACTCPTFYTSDGATCVDLDECAQASDLCGAGACTNEVGTGYACSCLPHQTTVVAPGGETLCRWPYDCFELKALESTNVADGVYTIDPDGLAGAAAFDVYCDMNTDGGGWTLVLNQDDTAMEAGGSADGSTTELCYDADGINRAYSTLAIHDGVMLDALNGAIAGENWSVRTVISPIVEGTNSTLQELFMTAGDWQMDAEDDSNITNIFSAGLDCAGVQAMWNDYWSNICLTSNFLNFHDTTSGSVPFFIGSDVSPTVPRYNHAGWPQAPMSTIHYPSNFRIWVR